MHTFFSHTVCSCNSQENLYLGWLMAFHSIQSLHPSASLAQFKTPLPAKPKRISVIGASAARPVEICCPCASMIFVTTTPIAPISIPIVTGSSPKSNLSRRNWIWCSKSNAVILQVPRSLSWHCHGRGHGSAPQFANSHHVVDLKLHRVLELRHSADPGGCPAICSR